MTLIFVSIPDLLRRLKENHPLDNRRVVDQRRGSETDRIMLEFSNVSSSPEEMALQTVDVIRNLNNE